MPFALLIAAAAVAAPPASAPLQVTTRLQVERRVALPDGTVRVEPAPDGTRAVPGDRMAVTVAYRNNGTVALNDVAIANPIPRGLIYRSSESSRLEVSVDGTRFGTLSTLSTALPGGGSRPARPEDVVAVRWRLSGPLAPGSSGQFSFGAIIK